MLGIRLGVNISPVNSDTIEITMYNRETGEMKTVDVNNTRFVKRLVRHLGFWNDEFVVDSVKFGIEKLKDI